MTELTVTCPHSLAFAFAGVHRDRLRYVAAWKRWMAWDGARWRADDTLLAPDLARGVCASVITAARRTGVARDAARVAHRLGGTAAPAAIERLARADRKLAAEPAQFDADPDLLNTPSGIVDTRTGEMLPHRPDAWMTRVAAVAPAAPGTPCPLWSAFLDRVTGGDAALAFYLQRVAGYALTGRTAEHALFFAHGTGANGKSLFLGTLARLLGDYADVASLDTIASDLPRFAAARLVTVEDPGDGRAFPIARIKALTGGDRLVARSRGGAVAVTPRFKLLFAGNERPSLSRVDEALRRRLHLVPFAVTIPEAERDPFLAEKLDAELPAILRWAIEGALARALIRARIHLSRRPDQRPPGAGSASRRPNACATRASGISRRRTRSGNGSRIAPRCHRRPGRPRPTSTPAGSPGRRTRVRSPAARSASARRSRRAASCRSACALGIAGSSGCGCARQRRHRKIRHHPSSTHPNPRPRFAGEGASPFDKSSGASG